MRCASICLAGLLCLFFSSFISNLYSQNFNSIDADSLYSIGDYQNAIKAYSRDSSLRSSLQIARSLNNIGLDRKAIEVYTYLISKKPDWDIARFEAAKIYYYNKNYDASIKHLDTLLSRHPEQSEFLYYKGLAEFGKGKPKAAVTSWRLSVQNDSTQLRSLLKLGTNYIRENRQDSALYYLRKGLSIYPDHVALLNLNALALFNSEQFREAIPKFKRLLHLGEKKAHIWQKLGESYLNLSYTDSAIAAFRQLLTFEEYQAEALFGIGRSYHRKKVPDSARVYYQKTLLARDPMLAAEYQALATLEQEEGNFVEALDFYERLLEEIGDNIRVEYHICTLSDKIYSDKKSVISRYRMFLEKYGHYRVYYTDVVKKRISQLELEENSD